MKKLAYIFCLFLASTGLAIAQQVQERQDQQPAPVTQQQVERDAKMAKEERKKDEEQRKELERQQKENAKKSATSTSNSTNTSGDRKSSNQPEGQ
jgi:cytoskeletal protein RodZ